MKENHWGKGKEIPGGKPSLFLACVKLLFKQWAYCARMRYDWWALQQSLSGWGHICWSNYSWWQPPIRKLDLRKLTLYKNHCMSHIALFFLIVLSPKFFSFYKNFLKCYLNFQLCHLSQKEIMSTLGLKCQRRSSNTVKVLVVINENPKGGLHLREHRVTWVVFYLLSNVKSSERDFLTTPSHCR